MTILDIITVIFLIFFLIYGYFKGFFRQVFTLAGLIGGIYGAFKLGPILSTFIPLSPVPSRVLAYLAVFVLSLIFFIYTGHIFHRTFKKIHLGFVDGIFGSLIGAVKGLLILFVFFYTAHLLGFPIEEHSNIARKLFDSVKIFKKNERVETQGYFLEYNKQESTPMIYKIVSVSYNLYFN